MSYKKRSKINIGYVRVLYSGDSPFNQVSTDKRVSKGSADQLRPILETFAGDVAEEPIAIARDEGYQTVKGEHIREALR